MELVQLKYFREVARTEHLSKAADILHVTQSTLSHSISKLENELGIELFIRDGRRIRLSAAGEIFLKSVDKVFLNIDSGVTQLNSLKEDNTTEIRIASFTGGLISVPLESFMASNPHIHVKQSVLEHEQIKAGLENDKVDIALSLYPIEEPFALWEKIATDELALIVSAENELSHMDKVPVSALRNQMIALADSSGGISAFLKGLCMSNGFRANILYEGGDGDMVMSMVKKNRCILIVPASIHIWKILSDKRNKTHLERPFSFVVRQLDGDYSFDYGLCLTRSKQGSEITMSLYNEIKKYFEQWADIQSSNKYHDLLKM